MKRTVGLLLVALALIATAGQPPTATRAADSTPVALLYLPAVNGPMLTPTATPRPETRTPTNFSVARGPDQNGDAVVTVRWTNPTDALFVGWDVYGCTAGRLGGIGFYCDGLDYKGPLLERRADSVPGAARSHSEPAPDGRYFCYYLVVRFSVGFGTGFPGSPSKDSCA